MNLVTSPAPESIEFVTAEARDYADYWESLPKVDSIPMRSSFDPAEVVPILPGFAIHEFTSPNMIKVRLAGTGIVKRLGYDPTGKNHLDGIDPNRRKSAYHALSNIIRRPCGMVVHIRMTRKSGGWVDCEVLGFPYRSESGEIETVIYQVNNISLPPPRSLSDATINLTPLWRKYFDIGAGVPDWTDIEGEALNKPVLQCGVCRPDVGVFGACDIPCQIFSGHPFLFKQSGSHLRQSRLAAH